MCQWDQEMSFRFSQHLDMHTYMHMHITTHSWIPLVFDQGYSDSFQGIDFWGAQVCVCVCVCVCLCGPLGTHGRDVSQ